MCTVYVRVMACQREIRRIYRCIYAWAWRRISGYLGNSAVRVVRHVRRWWSETTIYGWLSCFQHATRYTYSHPSQKKKIYSAAAQPGVCLSLSLVCSERGSCLPAVVLRPCPRGRKRSCVRASDFLRGSVSSSRQRGKRLVPSPTVTSGELQWN